MHGGHTPREVLAVARVRNPEHWLRVKALGRAVYNGIGWWRLCRVGGSCDTDTTTRATRRRQRTTGGGEVASRLGATFGCWHRVIGVSVQTLNDACTRYSLRTGSVSSKQLARGHTAVP